MEYQYVTGISAQKTVQDFSKTDKTAEVGLGVSRGLDLFLLHKTGYHIRIMSEI